MCDFIYEYKKIKLRKVRESDLIDLLKLKNESWFGTHKISILNIDNQKSWYESLVKQDIHSPKKLYLIAGNQEVDKFGLFKFDNIDWVNRKADVGWDIFKEERGKGYCKCICLAAAMFAKEILNIRKINAEILENNTASLKCAEKIGFIKEGRKRKEVFREGKYIDSFTLGLILEEELIDN